MVPGHQEYISYIGALLEFERSSDKYLASCSLMRGECLQYLNYDARTFRLVFAMSRLE